MNKDEEKIIDECILSYKNMIKYHKERIFDLELRKLKIHVDEACPECFKFRVKKKEI